jgi:hypothetical protein
LGRGSLKNRSAQHALERKFSGEIILIQAAWASMAEVGDADHEAPSSG